MIYHVSIIGKEKTVLYKKFLMMPEDQLPWCVLTTERFSVLSLQAMVIHLVLVKITFLETAAHHLARELSNRFTISLLCAHRHFHFTAFELIGFSHYRACSTAWEKTDVQYHLTRIFSTGRESFVRMFLKIWLSRYNVVRINRVPSKNP